MFSPRSRWLLVPLALLLLPAPGRAQFTLRGGVDLARFFGADTPDTERKRDLGFSGAFSLLGAGPVALSAEAYYRRKGARSVEEFQAAALAGDDVEVGIDYVEVPVLLRLNLPALGRHVLPYVEGGPAFAWRLDCSVLRTADGEVRQACDDLAADNLENTLRDYEQGLALGAGFALIVPRGMGALDVNARLTRGLCRLAAGSEARDVKNEVFSLMPGYRFGAGELAPR